MPKKRKVDMFAGFGSLGAALKARREAVESGNLEGAPKVFRQAMKKPKPRKR